MGASIDPFCQSQVGSPELQRYELRHLAACWVCAPRQGLDCSSELLSCAPSQKWSEVFLWSAFHRGGTGSRRAEHFGGHTIEHLTKVNAPLSCSSSQDVSHMISTCFRGIVFVVKAIEPLSTALLAIPVLRQSFQPQLFLAIVVATRQQDRKIVIASSASAPGKSRETFLAAFCSSALKP